MTSSLALVVAAHGQRGQIETAHGARHPYLVKGKRLRVVCGDRVEYIEQADGDEMLVSAIEARRNVLARVSPGAARTEILAANVDTMMVVCASEPAPDWFLIDRYLCAAELMDCNAILISNKADLGTVAGTEAYASLGYTVIPVSTRSGDGIGLLLDALNDDIGILVGQSGVGKSSLINKLTTHDDVAVAAISKSTREGRHTTAASLMHTTRGGGRLIDTPGVREFIPAIAKTRLVQAGFREIVALADQCRFHNCEHLREPACAIIESVENGDIDPRRYESYKRLMNNIRVETSR